MSTVDNKAVADTTVVDEFKDQIIKHPLSKFEYDLYHEEDDVSMPVIRVKKTNMPNKGEKWKVMLENKVIFVIESIKLSKKERDFLRTIEGFNFIIAQGKAGIKSFNSFRAELKKVLEPKPIIKKVGRPRKNSKK